MEVVVAGKGRLVQETSLRPLQPKDLANPLQGLQGSVHGVQRHHGMALTDHLVDLSRAGVSQPAHSPVHGGALGRQPEPVSPK